MEPQYHYSCILLLRMWTVHLVLKDFIFHQLLKQLHICLPATVMFLQIRRKLRKTNCVPKVNMNRNDSVKPPAVAIKIEWLEKIRTLYDIYEQSSSSSWAGHHASKLTIIHPRSLSNILPLFPDVAHATTIIKHAFDIVKQAINFMNPAKLFFRVWPAIICEWQTNTMDMARNGHGHYSRWLSGHISDMKMLWRRNKSAQDKCAQTRARR